MLQRVAAQDDVEQRSGGDSQRTRIDALTGLRAVAALSVLFAHSLDTSFVYSGHLIGSLHSVATRLAWFGMSLFFVLSGFVIQLNYGRLFERKRFREAGWQFFVARFSRLYPLYALMVVLSLAYLPSPYFKGHIWTGLAYFTLVQSWFNVQSAVFQPGWSVSTEWFFYLAFVPLTFVFARLARRQMVVFAALLVTAPIGLIVMTHYSHQIVETATPWLWHGEKVSTPVWGWIIYFSPYTRVLEFMAGVLAARVYQEIGSKDHRSTLADVITICCVAWCFVVIVFANATKNELGNIAPNFIYAPEIAVSLILVSRYRTHIGRILSTPAIVFLGEISYSIYIWCWFAMTLLDSKFGSPTASALAYVNSGLKVVLIIGTTIIFATGSYQLVEMPAQRWLRRRLLRA